MKEKIFGLNSCEEGYNTVAESNKFREKKMDNSFIICLNTNKTYRTLKEASADTGVDLSAFQDAMEDSGKVLE